LKEIGVEMKVKEVWKIAGDKEKGKEIVGIKIEKEEKRREIKKKNLRGRKERIHEDWKWKEKRMKWKLEEIARLEKRKKRKG